MKIIRIIIALFFVSCFCNAQQLVRDNLNAGYQENTNVIGVIGEVFNQYNTNTNIIIETILDFTDTTLSTSEFDLANQIKVYPNPTNNVVNIKFPNDFKGNYTLYDKTGKLIYKHNIDALDIQFSLESYASGLYLLVLTNDNGKQIQSHKILKQ